MDWRAITEITKPLASIKNNRRYNPPYTRIQPTIEEEIGQLATQENMGCYVGNGFCSFHYATSNHAKS